MLFGMFELMQQVFGIYVGGFLLRCWRIVLRSGWLLVLGFFVSCDFLYYYFVEVVFQYVVNFYFDCFGIVEGYEYFFVWGVELGYLGYWILVVFVFVVLVFFGNVLVVYNFVGFVGWFLGFSWGVVEGLVEVVVFGWDVGKVFVVEGQVDGYFGFIGNVLDVLLDGVVDVEVVFDVFIGVWCVWIVVEWGKVVGYGFLGVVVVVGYDVD